MMRKTIDFWKLRFPHFFRMIFNLRDLFLIVLPGRLNLLRIRKLASGKATVFYLTTGFPSRPAARSDYAHGGSIKLTYLAETFAHHFPSANLLYAVSSVGHPLRENILAEAKRKGLKIVINQNGVAFPAWDGLNYEASNRTLKTMISLADFIIYQSQFCKLSAERYLSPPNVPKEIVYNPVDTRLFIPDDGAKKPADLTLLLGGNQHQKYRLELALRTLQSLHREMPKAKLIVTGRLWFPGYEAQEWTTRTLKEMGLTDYVTFTGTYVQSNARAIFSQAHLLLHTQYADASPGVVLEAMAMALPVVHLGNGGVPELVGDAGISVPVDHSWDKVNLPDPDDMADAVLRVYSRCDEYALTARQRVLENFSLEKFISRHSEIFTRLLDA